MSRPRIRIEDDSPPARATCFLHDAPLVEGKCPACASVRRAVRPAGIYPCPKCQTPSEARRMMKALAAVCPACKHPFSPI